MRGRDAVRASGSEVIEAAAAGILSPGAYGTIIRAMKSCAMGLISALREISVVFAAVIGRVFLNEALTCRRAAACVVVALGAARLGFTSPTGCQRVPAELPPGGVPVATGTTCSSR